MDHGGTLRLKNFSLTLGAAESEPEHPPLPAAEKTDQPLTGFSFYEGPPPAPVSLKRRSFRVPRRFTVKMRLTKQTEINVHAADAHEAQIRACALARRWAGVTEAEALETTEVPR